MTTLSTVSSSSPLLARPSSDNSKKADEGFENLIVERRQPEPSRLPFWKSEEPSRLPFEPTPVADGLPFEPAPDIGGFRSKPIPSPDGLPFEPEPVNGSRSRPAPIVDGLPFEPMPAIDDFRSRPSPDGLPFEPGTPGDSLVARQRLAHLLWSGKIGVDSLLPSDTDA